MIRYNVKPPGGDGKKYIFSFYTNCKQYMGQIICHKFILFLLRQNATMIFFHLNFLGIVSTMVRLWWMLINNYHTYRWLLSQTVGSRRFFLPSKKNKNYTWSYKSKSWALDFTTSPTYVYPQFSECNAQFLWPNSYSMIISMLYIYIQIWYNKCTIFLLGNEKRRGETAGT